MATVKPPSPQRPLMQTNMKPPSPLQPKNSPKTPISHPQRRWRFQLRLSLRGQRRRRFHSKDFQCPRAMAEPGRASRRRTQPHTATQRRRCGGHRRDRRARAGFEIDHSERSSRVAISRAAGPDGARNTSGAASNKLNRKLRLHRRCEGRKRAWPRCPWAAAGPGRGAGGRRQGQGGLRDRPLRAAGSRVAISRAGRRPPAHTAAGPTSNTRPLHGIATARHSKRGRHQPTPCASALTHP